MDLTIGYSNTGDAQSFGVTFKRHGLRLKIAKRFVDKLPYAGLSVLCHTTASRAGAREPDLRVRSLARAGVPLFVTGTAPGSDRVPLGTSLTLHSIRSRTGDIFLLGGFKVVMQDLQG
jgi:hypothetical protein